MVAVIPEEVDPESVRKSVESYLERVNASSGKEYTISASVGIKSFDIADSPDFGDMVRLTDQLMYRSEERR